MNHPATDSTGARPPLHDVLVVAGLVLLGAGLWWVYPPAALITIGALLIAGGVVGFIRTEREKANGPAA